MAVENDYTKAMCDVEKNLRLVRILNPNQWKEEWKGTKNAVRIGTTATKKSYIVVLSHDEEGKEVLKVHTIRRSSEDVMETLEGQAAKIMFSRLNFY